jgi:glycosyltransferase involved in cell wall biosynthesis
VQRVAGLRVTWLPQWERWHTARYDASYLLPLLAFTLASPAVDMAHVHGNPYFLLRPRSRARVLHYQNSPDARSPRYGRALARADSVICCSRFIRQQLIEAVPYPNSRIAVVYNGFDRDLFERDARAETRARYAIPDGQPVLLYVGRIGEAKGLLVLVEALERIIQGGGPQPLLLVAGSGTLGFELHRAAWPALEAYERRVYERAGSLPVRFLGPVPSARLPALYQAADIFVCPSIYQDPFPLVNIEAAAAGLPVVASTVGGIPEAVRHEQTGLLFPPEDSGALAAALGRLLADVPLRRRLGAAGRELAARFDWGTLAREVLALYDGILGQASARRGSGAKQVRGNVSESQ